MRSLTRVKRSTKHFKHFVILVTGVVKNRGKFLLLKRSSESNTYPGCWQLPEGKLELAEQPAKALEREIEEELSCKTTMLKFISSQTTPIIVFSKKFYLLRIIARVKLWGDITLSDEHSQYNWVSKHDLEKYPLVPGTFEACL